MTICLQNTTDFMEQYLEEAEYQQIPASVFYAPLTYDAVWSLALALNGSMTRLPATKKLEEFKYEEKDVTEVLMDEMEQLQFEGMTVGQHQRIVLRKVSFERVGVMCMLMTLFPFVSLLGHCDFFRDRKCWSSANEDPALYRRVRITHVTSVLLILP